MRKAFKPLALLALSTAFLTTPALAQDQSGVSTPAPMSALDLVTIPRLGGPSVSADGKRMLYSATSTDETSLARSTDYRLKTLATGEEVDPARGRQFAGLRRQ